VEVKVQQPSKSKTKPKQEPKIEPIPEQKHVDKEQAHLLQKAGPQHKPKPEICPKQCTLL